MIPTLIALGWLLAIPYRRGREVPAASIALLACAGWAFLVGHPAGSAVAAVNLIVGFGSAIAVRALGRLLMPGPRPARPPATTP